MKKLYVYADFDWLDTPQLIGELLCDSVHGSETYGFSYDKGWLAKYGDVFLCEDLQNYPGIQYTRPERDIFACFSDALPDRWGRTLLNRREQIAASDEKRPVRRLTSCDYLMGIDDEARMGGFVGHKTYTCSSNTLQLTASLPYYRCRQKDTVSHNKRYELLVKVIRSIISRNLSAIRSPYCALISGGVRFEVMMVNS